MVVSIKNIKVFFFIIFISLNIVSCSKDTNDDISIDDLNSLEYHQELNVSYGIDDGQKFDIYLPANRTLNTKVMILVHGGGWTGGDKNDMNSFKDFIRQDFPNVAIVNINYRLADANNNPYPMQIIDLTTIINHLKGNQEEYIISDKFGFIGISAGAHLSLLWCYAFDTDSNVNMVCSIVGPTNFTDPEYLNNTNPLLQEILDLYGIDSSIEFLEEVSPYHKVTNTAPPTILFYGGQDPLIPISQGIDLRDKLEELGITHQFTLYPDAGHGWTGLDLLDTWIKLKSFINNYL